MGAIEAVKKASIDPPGDEQLYQTLYDYKIIVKKNDPEKSPYIDYKYDSNSKKAGISIYLLVSQECNLRCKYCFADEFPYRQKKQMSFDIAKQAINKDMQRLQKNGKISLIFFGGEPLMNWPLIKETIMYVENNIKTNPKKIKISYHITTNLTNLPKDFSEWIKNYKISLLTDIDGHNAQLHDFLRPMANPKISSYKKIMNNIETLEKDNIKVETRASMCASNQNQIVEISKHLMHLSGGGSVLELLTPFDCSKNPLPEELLANVDQYIEDLLGIYEAGDPPVENIFPINKMLEKIRGGHGSTVGCGMPWGNIHIVDYIGDVYMCTFLVGQEDYKLGNVFDPGLSFCKEEETVNRVFKNIHVDFVEGCKTCPMKYLCTGHCPVARLAIEANERDGREVPQYVKEYSRKKSCKMTKIFYEKLLWDLSLNNLPMPPVKRVGKSEEKKNSCPL